MGERVPCLICAEMSEQSERSELGRTEDVARVTSDPAYRDKLIAEFKLA